MSLFGGSASNTRSKNLVEFKAGKMTLHGKLVKPDKRKGLVYIYQGEDSIMHFCWKDRTNGAVEDDLMIFPDDIEYKRVPQCTTGRVYLMKFKSTNKKFFFWMQEPDAEKDEKLWRKLNDYLNNPPPPGSSSSASIGGERGSGSSSAVPTQYADFAGLSHGELQHLLGSMNEQQMQQLFGGLIPVNSPTSNRSGSSNASTNQNSRAQSAVSRVNTSTPAAAPTATPTAATTTAPSATTTSTTAAASLNDPAIIAASTGTSGASGTDQSAKIQLNDLKNILGQLSGAQAEAIDLADIVTPDVMAPILANKEVQEKLIKYLPEGGDILPKNENELRNTFTTPQFKRAMYSFTEALKSGQLGPLMQQFNLPVEVANAAAKGNIEEFAKAMEDHMKSQKGQQKPKDDNNDDDNRMDT